MNTKSKEGGERQSLEFSQEECQIASASFVVFAVVLMSIAFIVPPTDAWQRSLAEHYDYADQAVEGTNPGGSLMHQIAIASVGLFGMASLVLRGGKRLRFSGTLFILCALYVAWCFASLLWTDDFSMSLRRLVSFGCELLAGMAIAQRCSPRQFVWIVLSCTLIWLGLGILAEFSLGTFQPWQPSYRFAGIFHPNEMGINCALLILSAIYLGYRVHHAAFWLYAIAGVATVFLLLTGSRTAFSTMFLLAFAWLYFKASTTRRIGAVFVAGMIAAGVVLGIGLGLLNISSNIFTVGRQDVEVSSLTGRLPLWDELLSFYVPQHLFTGCGYGSFWTLAHMEELTKTQYWDVASTHSTYIDLLLHVGIVGAVLCLSAMAVAIVKSFRLERQMPGIGFGFIGMVVASGLTQGIFETTTGLTSFQSFFGICGMSFLLLADPALKPVSIQRNRDRVREFGIRIGHAAGNSIR